MTISKTYDPNKVSKETFEKMSEAERYEHHMQSLAQIREERIAKRDPNAIVNNLLDKNKNYLYEGVAIGGNIEPANNWYQENTYLLTDLSLNRDLSERIDNEIVKPINDYLFEKTGTMYVHDKIPNYKGYADVPNVYDSLFNKVCENIQHGFSIEFETFAEEYIKEHKEFIDEEIEKGTASFNKDRSIEEIGTEVEELPPHITPDEITVLNDDEMIALHNKEKESLN